MRRALDEVIAGIEPANAGEYERAHAYHDTLTKPPGSLGRLEEIGCRLCAVQRRIPPKMERTKVVIFAADHGVTNEGVSPYPSEVTGQMVANFTRGGAAINAIGRSVGATLCVVDTGVRHPVELPGTDRFRQRRVAHGTANMVSGPAMTQAQTAEAVEVGLQIADECASENVDAVALGEMGIGNTTAASAVSAVLLGRPVAEVTGRGTGADDATLTRKVDVIQRALARTQPHRADPLDVLRKVGGLELAALCGIAVGLARRRIAVVADGFICTAAVLAAVRLHAPVNDYVFCGQRSPEPGHRHLLEALGQRPLLDLGMRLGEGTGAALSLPILQAAAAVLRDMATFESARVTNRGP